MKFLRWVLLVVLIGAGMAGALLYLPVSPPGETFVDLPSGTSARAMSVDLQRAGVLRSRYAFLLLRVWKGGRLKAGEYRFSEPANAVTVYTRIAKGDVYTRAVTIPEGFNLFDVARAVAGTGLASAEGFLAAARANTDLIADIAPAATSLEGYLYPDTYRFSRHTTPRQMLEAMVHRFRTEAAQLGLRGDVGRTVTLASLVEKEVHFDEERSMAAGVFENRLRQDMPLQTDPTVAYAALLDGRWRGTIYRSDLLADSPYNTYRHNGLPPGPICSPGAAALRAAMHPTRTDKLYFVADRTGHTQFSAGLAEHAQQVQRYREGAPAR